MVENSLFVSGNVSVTACDPCSGGWSVSTANDCVKPSPSENRTRLSRRSLVGDSESRCRAPQRLSGALVVLVFLLIVIFCDLL